MNISELNKLDILAYNLEYAISNDNMMFLLKTTEEDVSKFKKNDSAEFFISIDDEDNLNFHIDILNIKNKCRVGLEIPPSERDSHEIKEVYNILKNLNHIQLIVFSNHTAHTKKLKIFENDISNLSNWISNTKITETYEFQKNYANIPNGYLIPQKSDTLFWFVTKTTKDIYTIAKDNKDNLTFKADIFEGELVLYLANEKNLISVLQLADNIIDDSIREDFKLFINQEYVPILINVEGYSDKSILNLNLKIDSVTKDRIKYYLTI